MSGTKRRTLVAMAVALLALGGTLRADNIKPTANANAPARVAPARPNVVFIITDQHFAEVMSCRMGKQFINTPAMDSLARTGMVFTRAYSPNPLCMPTRTAMFSGYYPHQTGITRDGRPRGSIDETRFTCMGDYFGGAGYDRAYSGKWSMAFSATTSEKRGFEFVTREKPGSYDVGVTEGGVAFLERPHDKPFLLVLSYLNPHDICGWARRLAGRYKPMQCGEIGDPPPADQLPPPPANLAPPNHEPDGMAYMRRAYQVENGPFPVGRFTPEDWRRHRWGYYRMVELVDKEIGRVLETLRRLGLEENTLIVWTADHGECAGAHGFNQKTVFYEEAVRVPLVISWKGRTPPGTCDRLVNTGIDVLPTVRDVAGLATPDDLPGRSLLPLALGKEVPAWRDYVVVQNNMVQSGKIDGKRPTMTGRMVRTDRYKYCVFSRGQRRESLVDLQADPGEMNNLAADPKHRKVLLEHRELLARWGRENNDRLVAELLADDVKPIPFDAKQAAQSRLPEGEHAAPE